MQRQHFDFFAEFLKGKSGLILTPDKMYLLESRLGPVAAKWSLPSIEALAERLKKPAASDVTQAVVEAMTTNESSFFRDGTPFQHFSNVMLPLLKTARASARKITIWSAASSSGQEAYSLAMLLKEQEAQWQGWRFEIMATDLSTEMVKRARDGLYTPFEVQRGLPPNLLARYFKQEGGYWRLDDAIRRMVRFEQLNLLGDQPGNQYAGIGKFDIIFCRNVLIYFDRPDKTRVLNRLKHHLAPDGFMVLGGAETTFGLSDDFVVGRDQKGLYRLAGPSGARL